MRWRQRTPARQGSESACFARTRWRRRWRAESWSSSSRASNRRLRLSTWSIRKPGSFLRALACSSISSSSTSARSSRLGNASVPLAASSGAWYEGAMRNMVGSIAIAFALACSGSQSTEPQTAPGQNAAEAQPMELASAAPAEVAPAAASTPAVSAGHPREDLIPRAILFGNPDRTNVQISPDGKYLSWLAPSNGVLNVWVAKRGLLEQARPVTADEKRPVTRYVWTFDGKH